MKSLLSEKKIIELAKQGYLFVLISKRVAFFTELILMNLIVSSDALERDAKFSHPDLTAKGKSVLV